MDGFLPGKEEHEQSPRASFVSSYVEELPLCSQTELSYRVLRTVEGYSPGERQSLNLRFNYLISCNSDFQ